MKSDMKNNKWRIYLKKGGLFCTVLLFAALQTAAFYFCVWKIFAVSLPNVPFRYGELCFSLLYGGILAALTRVWRGFAIRSCSRSQLFVSHCLAICASLIFSYFLLCCLSQSFISPWPFLLVAAGAVILSIIWIQTAVRLRIQENVLVVYQTESDWERFTLMYRGTYRFSHTEAVKTTPGEATVPADFDKQDAVILVGVDEGTRDLYFRSCIRAGIPVYLMPQIRDVLFLQAKKAMASDEMLLCPNEKNPIAYLLVKRILDICISGVMLILTLPIMLITALLVKLEDGGPVFYHQTRLTMHAKEFEILKFRSMRTNAESDGKARLASQGDSRITRIGKFIRACRIDELPQLINILKGDMSIVGPRPERPEIVAEYEKILPEFALRLNVPAGLTGYAQVFGKYNTKPYQKLMMDLFYINHLSLTEDAYILLTTVRIVFSRESTEGVAPSAPQNTSEVTQPETEKNEG